MSAMSNVICTEQELKHADSSVKAEEKHDADLKEIQRLSFGFDIFTMFDRPPNRFYGDKWILREKSILDEVQALMVVSKKSSQLLNRLFISWYNIG